MLKFFALVALTAWVALYTVNFGRWMWRRGERAGAIGNWLLAAVAAGVSLGYLLFKWLT